MDHLLLHCKFACALWCEVFLMFRVQWVMLNTFVSRLFAWIKLAGDFFFKCFEYGTNVSYVINMWKECNSRTFEDIERPVDLLKSLLSRTLFEWPHIWGLMHCISMSNFLIFVSSALWFVCIRFKYSGFTMVNTLYFSYQWNFYYLSKKKKNFWESLVSLANWV